MTRDDLLAALLAERHNGRGWRTPGWEPPPRSEDDEIAGRRRLREAAQESREHERRKAG